MSEFRVALRRLIRSPLYSVLSILLLALGIGATSGLFSAVDAVLLRALPYPQPERLTMLWVDASAQGFSDTDVTNPADLADWRKQLRSFDEVAAFTVWQADLTGLGEPQQLPAAQVTQGYFGVLGVPLALGRDFTAEEDLPDGPRAVILSHAFWRERYGADPQALGQAITLNGEPHTIVGIAAPGLVSPSLSPRSLWRPLQGDTEQRGNYFLTAIGRLADGVSLNAARSEFDALQQRLAQQYPDTNRGHRGKLQPMDEFIAANLRNQLWVMFAATFVVLLVALAILINLGLARVARDRREWAVRAALGAARWRMLRLALLESLVLAAAGVLLALPLAQAVLSWVSATLLSAGATQLPQLDWRVLLFCVALSLAASALSALLPMRMGTQFRLASVLRDGDRASVGARSGQWLRSALVVSTFALALMLSVGAGLFLTSLERLRQVDPGFRPESVATFTLSLNDQRYPDRAALVNFSNQLREQMDAIAGVEVSGMTSALPLSNFVSDTQVLPEGMDPGGDGARAFYNMASPGYLQAMGATLLRGRDFSIADNRDGPCVVLSNQAFAQAHYAGDPLGRRVTFNYDSDNPLHCEVVGVVADVRGNRLNVPEVPSLYLPLTYFGNRFLFVVARGNGDPSALLPALRQAVASVDPLLALGNPQVMNDLVDAAMRNERTLASLSTAFAAATLLLAAIGVYGVLAYTVTQRRRELGVRAALGADQGSMIADVVGRGLRLAGTGIALGLVLAVIVGGALESLLYETGALEWPVLLGASAILAILALIATLPPALRASRSDPMAALRQD
ncbi:MAG: ABC transporter permease [Xanthomonadales bacterium]|nr:ABC transporter permease [Xanthomonadales bacterium]